ncbi:ATP synthase F1 subunit gamma [Candidatus Uhrbacteria bacterium]|nr:ATP synthase F1 subunit gamma [Candidatus Uhrbacteria bacterium]
MALSTRLIRSRIKSVANTRKITKAMELVAAAKMRKAIQLTLASRDYARTIRQVVVETSGLVDPNTHPLLAGRPTAKNTVLAIASSDRGLCGSFNAQLLRKAVDFLKSRNESVSVVTVGKRAEQAVRRAGYPILAAFGSVSNAPSFDRSAPIGNLLYTEFTSGRADRIFVAYTDFKNALTQIPMITQLLPTIPEAELKELTTMDDEEGKMELEEPKILFEPDAASLLDTLLPRLLEMQIYQSLLESAASEHSARNTAMHSATDNANNMLQDLTLTFNQARQAMITREISEISAGKAALE